MNAQQGYYSVLQYCPDLGKFEAANIGVLLFCPETGFLKGITTRTNQRVAHFFGREHDTKKLNSLKLGIVERLANEAERIKTLEDLKRFIALRANQVQITPPRSIRVEDPERDLASLFEEVIGEAPKGEEKKSFGKVVGERLLQPDLRDRIATDIGVAVPIFRKPVEFPFGYQNGRFNLIRPITISVADEDQCVRRISDHAVEGRALYHERDASLGLLQLVVIGRFPNLDSVGRESVRRVLEEFSVELYCDNQIAELVEKIRREGKPIPEALAKVG